MDEKLDIKITCRHRLAEGIEPVHGFPWRTWSVSLVGLRHGEESNGMLCSLLDRVEYILHPTFEKPHQIRYKEPYLIEEKGWGEFMLQIVLYFCNDAADPQVMWLDIAFANPEYSVTETVTLHHATTELLARLQTNADLSYVKEEIVTIPSSPAPSSPLSSFSLSSVSSGSGYSPQFSSHPTLVDARPSSPPLKTCDPQTIEDDVYQPTDVDHIHPIHSRILDDATRAAWGVPENCNMHKLAQRLCSLTFDQLQELQSILRHFQSDDMSVEERSDELVIDLYSLGPALLGKLWEYSEALPGVATST